MIEDPRSQSEFSTHSETLLPPPETIKPLPTPEEVAKAKAKKKKFFLIGGGFTFLFVLLIAVIASQPQPEAPAPPPTPTRIPTKAPSLVESELKAIDEAVEQANPDRPMVDPPLVDMEVKF